MLKVFNADPLLIVLQLFDEKAFPFFRISEHINFHFERFRTFPLVNLERDLLVYLFVDFNLALDLFLVSLEASVYSLQGFLLGFQTLEAVKEHLSLLLELLDAVFHLQEIFGGMLIEKHSADQGIKLFVAYVGCLA